MSTSSISTPRILTTAIAKKSAVSTPRILTTAILKKSSISTPRILCTVVPSTDTSYYFDTAIKANKDINANYDTVTTIQKSINQCYDTNTNIKADKVQYNDTQTRLNADIVQHYDTNVSIESKDKKSYYYDTYTAINADVTRLFDTSISIHKDINANYDTRVKTQKVINKYYDTKVKAITAETVTQYYDTNINVNADTIYYYDTSVNFPHDTTISTDTTPTNPFIPTKQEQKSGVVSISINLQELTLADSFSMDTTDNIQILDYVSGQILDFPYLYRVGETSQQDRVISLKGMYDVDEILYQSINYNYGNQTHTLKEHAEKIANALGKRLVYHADNFQHSQKWIGDGQTYESIISSLFGWSSSIPHKAINVFMRAKDNSLNIIQRGQEQTTTDITNTAHTRPIINKSLERTMINYSNSNGAGHDQGHNLYIEPLPFYGTLTMGEAVCTYVSGYLYSEQNQGNTTYYEYTGDGFGQNKYLYRKTTNHADGSITITTYNYSKTKSGVMVLGSETETTKDKDGNETTRKTVHAPLGGGFYGTSVYIDGEYQGSSIGTGSPASVASRYLTNQESITLGGANYGDNENPLGSGNVLKESVNVPTNDKSVMNSYLNELKWLNRKIKETVSMDIYNYNHVIDFSERVKFKGNTYFLQSNNITQTTKELKQSITLVRWY